MFELVKQAEIDTRQAPRIFRRGRKIGASIAPGVLLPERATNMMTRYRAWFRRSFYLAAAYAAAVGVLRRRRCAGKRARVRERRPGTSCAQRIRLLVGCPRVGGRLSRLFGVERRWSPCARSPPERTERCIRVGNRLWIGGPNMVRDESGSLISVTDLKLLLSQITGNVWNGAYRCAGILTSSREAAVLGQLADAAVLVVEANRTRKMAARKAKEFLDRAGVQLIGTILNNRTFPIPEAIYRIL